MTVNNDDQNLWAKLKKGDSSAFEIIYRNNIKELMNYGRRFTQDTGLIEDAVHDLFVYIWNHRTGISDTDSIKGYLFFSLRNALIKLLKTGQKNIDSEQHNFLSIVEDNKEQVIIDKETKAEWRFQLEKSMDVLSQREKEAIYLKYHNNMCYDDICKIMDINYQSVRNLMSKSLKKLHDQIRINQKQ